MTVPHLNSATIVFCVATVLWIFLTGMTSGQSKRHMSNEAIYARRKKIAAHSPLIKCIEIIFVFVFMPATNLAEEILFRGILLFLNDSEILLALYFLPVQGFAWGIIHLIEHKKDFTREAVVYRMFFNGIEGCLYGGIALASGSIVLPLILHIGSNFHHFVKGVGSALFCKTPT